MKQIRRVVSVILTTAIVATAAPCHGLAMESTAPEEAGADARQAGVQEDAAYSLVWQDEFDGAALDRSAWNVETHEAGWVNSEWQEYVDSEDNIYLKDGNLVIRPIKSQNEDGTTSYTSGRISTQNKETFTYGKFEVRAKVPSGQGYLPAFWLMANDENIYGQWPRCGEIDAMEVMGQDPSKVYGTIHYGNPHAESQGTCVTQGADFAEDFHIFTCEWEPGKITWYVDGIKYHEESSWYSKTPGQGELTYPAPFDQPFYIILNLAVGGSWVGNPDETTSFENQTYEVDYVRVYQKDSYDENVEKPVKEVTYREPDAEGNYIHNGKFAAAEDLTDDVDWKFLTALGGEADAKIAENKICIETQKPGTADYSVQLVQPELPIYKGATYEVSFDAYADENRTMIVDVSAPDRSYQRYLADTKVDLTTEKKTYTYTFTMTDDDDANGRLEYNLGNTASSAAVYISNVSVKKIKDAEPGAYDKKTVLADGNLVYNGSFQEGSGHLGYWDITKAEDATVSVTGFSDGRRLKVVSNGKDETRATAGQQELAFVGGKNYVLTFDAQAKESGSLRAVVAGKEYATELTTEKTQYSFRFTTDETINADNDDILFYLGDADTVYLDNVRVVEDGLIKNGDFSAGTVGFTGSYVDGSANAKYSVDSLSNGGNPAMDFEIKDTGDAAWKIQLKQDHIKLTQNQWYHLEFKARSTTDRKLMFALQRDGSSDDDWTPYSGEKIVNLTEEYQTYSVDFKMDKPTDPATLLSISLGAVDGIQIQKLHHVYVDDIVLEPISNPSANNIFNPGFEQGSDGWNICLCESGAATTEVKDKSLIYHISDVGTQDYSVQLKQYGIELKKGETYQVAFKLKSSVDRTVRFAMLGEDYNYAWYGGSDFELKAGEEKKCECTISMSHDTDKNAAFVLSMGLINGASAGDIAISNVSLIKQGAGDEPAEPDEPSNPSEPSNPTEPTEPGTPTDPTEPTQPINPTNPTDPSEPGNPTDPSEPENPTDPSEPENPTDPSEPENPTEPAQPEKPGNSKVEVTTSAAGVVQVQAAEKVSRVTESINAAGVTERRISADDIAVLVNEITNIIEKAKELKEEGQKVGTSRVTIDMAGATFVPAEILSAAKGFDIDVVLSMNSAYAWTINGKKITAGKPVEVNLETVVGAQNIPQTAVKEVAGENQAVQLALTHSGDFGFEATLKVSLGAQYKGQQATLYYYDKDRKWNLMNAGVVREDGTADFTFQHASDYAIVIGAQAEKSAKTGDDTPWMGFALLFLAGVGVLVGEGISRKKQMKND